MEKEVRAGGNRAIRAARLGPKRVTTMKWELMHVLRVLYRALKAESRVQGGDKGGGRQY